MESMFRSEQMTGDIRFRRVSHISHIKQKMAVSKNVMEKGQVMKKKSWICVTVMLLLVSALSGCGKQGNQRAFSGTDRKSAYCLS